MHKPFFIAGAVMTGTFFALSLLAERWLRSKRVLCEAMEEKALWIGVGVLDSMIGVLGGVELVLLS